LEEGIPNPFVAEEGDSILEIPKMDHSYSKPSVAFLFPAGEC
jgi:hypothetical protein